MLLNKDYYDTNYFPKVRKAHEEDYYFSELLPGYINDLLDKELKCAAGQNGIVPLQKGITCKHLALLVGYSIEPLLQSIKVYQPESVSLIVSEEYGRDSGETWGENVRVLLTRHMKLPKQQVDVKLAQPSTPSGVFQALLACCKKHAAGGSGYANEAEEKKPLIIDITGGKKSMVAGAFLYAAFVDAAISYVDFKEYSPAYGRPYGYTCNIGILENPMKKFQLNEWNRIRDQYGRYSFRNCGELLEDMQQTMKGYDCFGEDQMAAVSRMRAVMGMYERWDNSDYRAALDADVRIAGACQVKIPVPRAVSELGTTWFEMGAGSDALDINQSAKNLLDLLTGMEDKLFANLQQALVYAGDELCKIKRLIKHREDYRSALLRAAGLNEFIIKAQAVVFCQLGYLEGRDKQDRPVENQIVQDFLMNYSTGSDLIGLMGQGKVKVRFRGDKGVMRIVNEYLSFSIIKRVAQGEGREKLLNDDKLATLRNKSIHTCLPVSRKLADGAAELVEQNLDQLQEWALEACQAAGCAIAFPDGRLEWSTFEAMPWNELCKICGIDFLPE